MRNDFQDEPGREWLDRMYREMRRAFLEGNKKQVWIRRPSLRNPRDRAFLRKIGFKILPRKLTGKEMGGVA